MAYQFDFLPVVQNTDLLLRGALFTLELTAIGAVLGVGLGIVGALVRAWKIQPVLGDLRGLRRVDPQHAVPGAAVFHLLRPAVPRACRFPNGRRRCWRW